MLRECILSLLLSHKADAQRQIMHDSSEQEFGVVLLVLSFSHGLSGTIMNDRVSVERPPWSDD